MRKISTFLFALLSCCSVLFSSEQVVVSGEKELVLSGDEPLKLRDLSLWNHGGNWVTDASYATLRERDGSVTLMTNGYTRYLRWTGSRLAEEDAGNSGLGVLRQHTYNKTAMMPRSGFRGFLGSGRNKELQDRPEATHYWITNVYQISSNELLGFIHQEDWGACFEKYAQFTTCDKPEIYRIAMAYSRDRGVSWTWLGTILSPYHDRNYVSNINGVPITVTKNGYMHIYFTESRCSVVEELENKTVHRNDLGQPIESSSCRPYLKTPAESNQYPAVARAKLDDVIAAARKGSTVPWFKYNNGQWNAKGMGGLGSNIITEYPEAMQGLPLMIYTEGDAAYSPSLNKYLLLVPIWIPRNANENLSKQGLYLYFSDDGVLWDSPRQLVAGADEEFFRYASFIGKNDGISSDDFNVLGSSFYILYAGMRRAPKGDGTGSFWKYYPATRASDGSAIHVTCGDAIETEEPAPPCTPANIYRTEVTVAQPEILMGSNSGGARQINGTALFQLTDFPQNWNPKSIVFQISSIDGKPLAGTVTIGSHRQNLSDWTNDLKIIYNKQSSIDLVIKMPSQRQVVLNWWADGAEGDISIGTPIQTEPDSDSSVAPKIFLLNEIPNHVEDGIYHVNTVGTCYNGIVGLACNDGQCRIEFEDGRTLEPGWWSTFGLISARFRMSVSGGGLSRLYCW